MVVTHAREAERFVVETITFTADHESAVAYARARASMWMSTLLRPTVDVSDKLIQHRIVSL